MFFCHDISTNVSFFDSFSRYLDLQTEKVYFKIQAAQHTVVVMSASQELSSFLYLV